MKVKFKMVQFLKVKKRFGSFKADLTFQGRFDFENQGQDHQFSKSSEMTDDQ